MMMKSSTVSSSLSTSLRRCLLESSSTTSTRHWIHDTTKCCFTRTRASSSATHSTTRRRMMTTSSSSSQSSLFSTVAAALEEPDVEEDIASSTPPPPKSNHRPRLDALRNRLAVEHHQEASPIIPTIEKYSNNNNNGGCSTSSKADDNNDDDDEMDLDELLEKLDKLPLPSTSTIPSKLLKSENHYKYPGLVDTYGRHHSYLRISLSEKCNLRCLYCMPEDGVPLQPQSNLLSNHEIIELTKWFVTYGGITKLRLTGGEPLLRKDLSSLIYNISKETSNNPLEQIGMTTNGVTLSKHLPDLVDAGLTNVNISLDSLHAEKFSKLTRRPISYYDRVIQSIEDSANLLPHRTKINCVVMPDNINELYEFAKLTKKYPIDVRFIEYMPFNDNQWDTKGFISYKQMMNEQFYNKLERINDGPNDTTKWWTLKDDDSIFNSDIISSSSSSSSKQQQGRIGFITSMSNHFCSTCNRLRITADGKLKVCLFGKTEVSLRDLLRKQFPEDDNNEEEELLQVGSKKEDLLHKLIHYSVQKKHFKLGGHSDMQDLNNHSTENRPMTLIGG